MNSEAAETEQRCMTIIATLEGKKTAIQEEASATMTAGATGRSPNSANGRSRARNDTCPMSDKCPYSWLPPKIPRRFPGSPVFPARSTGDDPIGVLGRPYGLSAKAHVAGWAPAHSVAGLAGVGLEPRSKASAEGARSPRPLATKFRPSLGYAAPATAQSTAWIPSGLASLHAVTCSAGDDPARHKVA